MTSLLLKKDQRQFRELAARILPRKGQGCLAFATCERGELQAEILAGLKSQLGVAFRLREHLIKPNQVYLGDLSAYDPESPDLHVFTGYPYDRLAAEDPRLVEEHRQMAEVLNIERDLLQQRNLHLIFILPRLVENTIALVAPDFYHFRAYSIHFQADLLAPLPKPRKLDLAAMERFWFLEKKFAQSSDRIHKANAHFELADWHMSANEMAEAKQHLDKAVKLYEKQKFAEGLVAAYESMADYFFEQRLSHQAELWIHKILKTSGGRNKRQASVNFFNLANCAMDQCKPDAASAWLQKATGNGLTENDLVANYAEIAQTLNLYLGETSLCLAWLNSLNGQSIEPTNKIISNMKELLFEQLGHVEGIEYPRTTYYFCAEKLHMGEWSHVIKILLLTGFASALATVMTIKLFYYRREFESAMNVMLQLQAGISKTEDEHTKRELKAWQLKIERHTKPAAVVEAECLACLTRWQNYPAHECVMLRVVLGFIYCDSDRPAMAWEMVQQASAVAEHARYRFLEAELAMLAARLLGKEGKWPEAYDKLKHGYERVRDHHVALEAEVLELMGQAAEQCGNPRARGWYQMAHDLYAMLELKQAAVVAAALARLT